MTVCHHRVAEYLTSLLHIENQKDINYCTVYLGHVDLVELIPFLVKPQLLSSNLQTCFGHGLVPVDSISGTLHPDHWLQWYITSLNASVAREPSLLLCARRLLILQECSSTFWHLVFFFILLATFFAKKAWCGNWFSCQWSNHAAGTIMFHDTSSVISNRVHYILNLLSEHPLKPGLRKEANITVMTNLS